MGVAIVIVIVVVTGGYGEVVMAAVRFASRSSTVAGCCARSVTGGIAIPVVAVSAVVVVTQAQSAKIFAL